jgi:hypothetical protein
LIGLLEVSDVDMGLALRGGAVPMPERLPDAQHVCPTLQERGGEAEAQGVGEAPVVMPTFSASVRKRFPNACRVIGCPQGLITT